MQGEEVTLVGLRSSVAPLLSARPGDAVAAYYALEHDARRVRLFVEPAVGSPRAFAAVCQTGLDLFRPLVVMRGEGEPLRRALAQALAHGRPYLFSAPMAARDDIQALAIVSAARAHAVFVLEAGAFVPVMNVLTIVSRTPDGQIRAAIRGRDGDPVAEAGTSWLGKGYAEVYVRVRDGARGRGLGKSVASAVCVEAQALGRAPIFVTAQDNAPAQGVARRLGFRDTGAIEWSGSLSRAAA
ncbi:MAG: GNAT family N-acetyltransferase [Thermoflexales bacterium]